MEKPRKPLLHHLYDYFLPHPRNDHRPHLFSTASVAALIVAIIVFEGAYLVQTKIVFLNTDFLASVLPSVLADLTNKSRAENGVAPVTRDVVLDAAAQAAAEDMAANGYFAHISPDGKTPWYWLEQADYAYSYAGENLAVNFTDSMNVETAWMESPTHRANIVKREYTHVGFGTANGMYEGQETTFVVEFFATPALQKTPPTSVALATPPVIEATTSAVTSQVLGTQTVDAGASGAAAAAAPAPAAPNWLARLLASPLNTLIALFTTLFALIAASFTITIVERRRRIQIQHPRVIIDGSILLVLISVAMLISSGLAGSVQLNSGTQTASVGAALQN